MRSDMKIFIVLSAIVIIGGIALALAGCSPSPSIIGEKVEARPPPNENLPSIFSRATAWTDPATGCEFIVVGGSDNIAIIARPDDTGLKQRGCTRGGWPMDAR